jgi:hypothetical protein
VGVKYPVDYSAIFCLQEKPFRLTRTLLFDGEMGLQSKKAQTEIQKRFGLEVYAQPGFKRLLAERAIREVKLRTAICLQLKGRVFLIHPWFIGI